MTDKVFRERYKKLNAKQREAVDTIHGPVMVVAGPGTGKTSILTLRIANILKRTDTPADAILALTFTEAGVATMRKKLLEIIGPRAYEVRIHSFHSFANELIKRYPEAFSRIIGAEHMENLEQVHIVETLLARACSPILRPKNSPAYYVLPVIDAIKKLKREDVSPKEYARLISYGTETKTDKNKRSKELAKVYRAYEAELTRRRLYDFEDMVLEAVRALLRNHDFKQELQEEYQFVLADEHQDANRSQNRLLELLSDQDEQPNLFIVGDEKQAIFRFQGASLENFLYFQKRFPKARLIVLTENYRSQPTVLAAAHALIGNSPVVGHAFRKELTARATHPKQRIRAVEAPDEASELMWITDEIEALIRSDAAPREIAVLTRENKDAEKVWRTLERRGICAARRGDADALQSVRIDALRKLFAAVLDPTDDVALAPVLFFDFLKLPQLSVIDALKARSEGTLIRRMARYCNELAEMQKKIMSWHRIAHNEPLVVAFEHITHESGFLTRALARADATETLALYSAFLESATRLAERDKRARLGDFLARLNRAEAHGIGIASSAEAGDGVQVMTAHKAKGLEFDYVFIAFAQDGAWGGKRSRTLFDLPIYENATKDESVHDERRLFYVALTRARKGAAVSWHAKGEGGRAALPSRFIFEMGEYAVQQHSCSISSQPDVPRRQTSGRSSFLKDKQYLNELFLNQGFAVTHLNNFLECTLKYFFLNLVRLPRAQSNAELYGAAMHAGLAAYFRAYSREKGGVSEALVAFENSLRRTHIAERDFKAYLAEGKRELKGYLASQVFSRVSWSEYRVGGIFLSVGTEKVELTGTLDKVELLPDGSVRVVDYKTGRPKTRNDLLGKTKDADGNYYRQLVFYQLLLNEYKKSSWRMSRGAIDFIKPAKNGSYRREEFEIADIEVAALKKQLFEVAAQILDLSFLSRGCSDKDCEWCRLYQSMA